MERRTDAMFRRATDGQRDARHDTERPLAPEEQVTEIGPRRCAWRGAGLDDVAVRQNGLQGEHDVLDVAVARRELARGASSDPAADAADADGLRVMSERQLFFD